MRLPAPPLLALTLLGPVVTFAITFPVAILYNDQDLDPPLHTLSGSIDTPPASSIGTFGVVVSALAMLGVVLLRHLHHLNVAAAARIAAMLSPGSICC